MDREQLFAYCLSKPGSEETYPFDMTTAVFKVMNKMFALIGTGELSINLKCEPSHAEALRSLIPAVRPGYHMNKTHWNTVIIDGSIPDDQIVDMIDHSYDLVVKGLRARDREYLAHLTSTQQPVD